MRLYSNKLFAVIYTIGGYAREDASRPAIAGIFTSKAVADKVRSAVGVSAEVKEVKLDEIAPCYIDFAKNVLGVDLEKIQEKEDAELSPMDELAIKCRMTADEFKENVECGGFIPSDGCGYWSTETEESVIDCWDEQPSWATHVCWYNN